MTIPVFKPNKRTRKYEDLSGRTFNRLSVLYRTSDYVTKSGTAHVQYSCECECGAKCIVRATSLKNGRTASCGCFRKERVKANFTFEDLTGQTFNRWTVLYHAESITEPSGRKATMWHCRCECGTERDIRAGTLKSGESKSCGCLKTDVLSKVRNLEGQTFGRWLVLGVGSEQVVPSGRRLKRWVCECECGEVREVTEQSLVRGKSISCGCYRKEQHKEKVVYEDLTGNKYGSWTVLERVPDRFYPGGGRATMWKCHCACGTENIVAGNMLKSGISQSCGCAFPFESKSETYVARYLDASDLTYTKQKIFDGLVGVGGRSLSYDFMVYKDGSPLCLIEYQGEQHFKPVEYFGGEEKLKIQRQHDQLKREHAEAINLPLIEIHYSHQTYKAIASELDKQFHSII
ncbi:hypothetical protein JUJ52_03255 [Virgibacillus sp. AGTR]|uniref:hypothetical protein n=1 Tax=Virgibacillus sp. AGTR TaxID=2812055 RepID=UPI001D15FB57|nr:hypothetical protein [Virgibacillus sp. AGTR]MCC2248975.1 hypothetical protein [Virgibacillus sp. AGTR]